MLCTPSRSMSDSIKPTPSATIALNLPNPEATRSLGIQLGEYLPAGSVLLLEGNLGSGKTTLVKGLAEGLQISDLVDSPTFTLINEYLDGRLPLYHFDLYRLNPQEASDLYPETYWEGIEVEPGVVAIEWAERLTYRPEDYLMIQFADLGAAGRQVLLTPAGQFDLKDILKTFLGTHHGTNTGIETK